MHRSVSDDVDDALNGFVFNGCFLPKEVVVHLLCFVDYKTLCDGRRVCRQWRIIVEDGRFWKCKARVDGQSWADGLSSSLNWCMYAQIYRRRPFGRNLIRNPCGVGKLKYWNVLSSNGDGFSFEQPPDGCERVPKEAAGWVANSCFVTSYQLCSKMQEIRLERHGLTREVLDGCHQPAITCSDWFAGRFDCGVLYECAFSLLNEEGCTLDEYTFQKTMAAGEGCSWTRVEHTFRKYPDGVVAVRFFHSGIDTQFWLGHFGPKMTGASVAISMPLATTSPMM